ncbi:hypothetical protein LGM60_19865 [Burkholderia vietnamiensis]|nr:hypothetical protein [Burkholderia vietnamiensis]
MRDGDWPQRRGFERSQRHQRPGDSATQRPERPRESRESRAPEPSSPRAPEPPSPRAPEPPSPRAPEPPSPRAPEPHTAPNLIHRPIGMFCPRDALSAYMTNRRGSPFAALSRTDSGSVLQYVPFRRHSRRTESARPVAPDVRCEPAPGARAASRGAPRLRLLPKCDERRPGRPDARCPRRAF